MLLKIERTILRKTSSSHKNCISLSEIGRYDGEDVYQAFLVLKERGYFELVDSSIDRLNFSYILSPKGRYYKEYLRLQFLKNILIPFIVALLTTVSTLYLEKFVENNVPSNTSANTCDYSDNN